MPHPLSAAVARLGRAVVPDDLSDGQLVGRFVRSRDEAAFAALVGRLGPMVLAVCRRVTADAHLAEDAFQAAFLVLARRAADVSPRGAVRGWLYGVAVRTAREARAMSARHRSREAPLADVPAQVEPSADPDALRALDEEVGRLPDHLRSAVVLCELDGLSRRDAAGRLGVPEGTLSSRLAKARKLLAARLRGRGVALGLAVGFARAADAGPVPAALADAAVGLAAAPELPPAPVAVLADRVSRTMFLHRLKTLTVAVLAGLSGRPDRPVAAADPPKPQAVTKPAGPNRLLVASGDKLVLIDPEKRPGEGKEEVVGRGLMGSLSPDGKWLVTYALPDGPLSKEGAPPLRTVIRRLDRTGDDVTAPTLGTGTSEPPRGSAWTADGSRLLLVQPTTPPRSDGWHEKVSWWLFDPVTKKADRVPVDVPAWHTLLDMSPDGQTFLTAHFAIQPGKPSVVRLSLVPRGGKPEFLTSDTHSAFPGRFSPDGKRILFIGTEGDDRTGHRFQLFVMSLADRKPVRISDPEKGDVALSCVWSPDGKRVAYVRKKMFYPPDPKAGGDPGCNFAVVVADADGRNPKVVAARTVIHEHVSGMAALGVFDWR